LRRLEFEPVRFVVKMTQMRIGFGQSLRGKRTGEPRRNVEQKAFVRQTAGAFCGSDAVQGNFPEGRYFFTEYGPSAAA